jgi:hypothetical protein
MTTRLKGFVVALEHDIRSDDAESIKSALEQIRGVLTVKPIESASEDMIVEQRVRRELGQKLWAVICPEKKEGEQ